MSGLAYNPKSGQSTRWHDIVASARALMRESDDMAFSMRTLAERAGVSIATPYNLFGSKQAILLAVLDADLAGYEAALGRLHADEIEVLFQGVSLMTSLLAGEPVFYRNVLSAVSRDGGPEFRFMVNGPRYILWKKLLRQATDAGLLRSDVDPDAFAITLSQQVAANLLEWAYGGLGVDELEARIHYGLALVLLAVATPCSRPQVEEHMRTAERTLQGLWQHKLRQRLERGPLDDDSRLLLADQLEHLERDARSGEIPDHVQSRSREGSP